MIACAYACTGAVRQGVDQWFPRFLQDVHGLSLDSPQFQSVGFLIPFVASAGSLLSGYVSDTIFGGRRAPVAAGLYFLETAIILLALYQFEAEIDSQRVIDSIKARSERGLWVAGQIIGSEPDQMAKAAVILAEHGYDVIDLNFACPVKKIKNKSRGGHMLMDVPRAKAILAAVRDCPISSAIL